jgi:predicted PurR-regulated permease PerM
MPQPSAAWQRGIQTLATFVLVILVIGCLYWAKPVLIPTALAILFTFLLSPVVTWLQRHRVPRVPAVVLVVSLAGLLLLGLGWMVANQVVNLANQLPTYQDNVTQRIADLRSQGNGSLLGKLNEFLEEVSEAAMGPLANEAQALQEPPPVRVVETPTGLNPGPVIAALSPLLEPIATLGLVIVLVIFMLLNREDVRNRLLSLFGQGQLVVTTRALDDAGHRISRYLLMQFCLNMGFGVFIGLGLMLIGLPHALLWGVLAATLRYIPVLGPWLAAIFPLSLSLLISPDWLQPILILLLFVAFELTSNLVMEPWLYGQSIGVAQAPLLVAIAFWTWLWGPLGLVLAAPLTVCLVVLGKYVPQLKFFDLLLGDQPPLNADMHFYQRLLARDEDEASDILREQLQEMSLLEACDRICIPAMVQSKRDFASDRLNAADAGFVIQATQEIAEEQSLAALATQSVVESTEPATPLAPVPCVFVCAAGDQADNAATSLVPRFLEPNICEVEIIGTAALVSEIIARVESEHPVAICIAALPPGGLARTRLLCKRLRGRFPQLKILVGRWGLTENTEANREQLVAAGADQIGTTLGETIKQISALAQSMRGVVKQGIP